jgi:hypothetical protein
MSETIKPSTYEFVSLSRTQIFGKDHIINFGYEITRELYFKYNIAACVYLIIISHLLFVYIAPQKIVIVNRLGHERITAYVLVNACIIFILFSLLVFDSSNYKTGLYHPFKSFLLGVFLCVCALSSMFIGSVRSEWCHQCNRKTGSESIY